MKLMIIRKEAGKNVRFFRLVLVIMTILMLLPERPIRGKEGGSLVVMIDEPDVSVSGEAALSADHNDAEADEVVTEGDVPTTDGNAPATGTEAAAGGNAPATGTEAAAGGNAPATGTEAAASGNAPAMGTEAAADGNAPAMEAAGGNASAAGAETADGKRNGSDKDADLMDGFEEVPVEETVYVSAKVLPVYDEPSSQGEVLLEFRFGAAVVRTGLCSNGFSHVSYHGSSGDYAGYVLSYALSPQELVEKENEKAVVSADTDILDYPGTRDGEITGEVLAEDVVTLCGKVGDTWSRILYEENGAYRDGYILTSSLKGHENSGKKNPKEGRLSKGSGEGVFADAVTGVTEAVVTATGEGVLIGTPQSVGETVTLKSLGIFRITHYCACSICCGPYANGITSTGVTAVTNHTIAVSPAQIPYGSRVAINGQVYVAEDCGGAIRTNCIDIYVASHAEALAKGVFYTEVYLVQ